MAFPISPTVYELHVRATTVALGMKYRIFGCERVEALGHVCVGIVQMGPQYTAAFKQAQVLGRRQASFFYFYFFTVFIFVQKGTVRQRT